MSIYQSAENLSLISLSPESMDPILAQVLRRSLNAPSVTRSWRCACVKSIIVQCQCLYISVAVHGIHPAFHVSVRDFVSASLNSWVVPRSILSISMRRRLHQCRHFATPQTDHTDSLSGKIYCLTSRSPLLATSDVLNRPCHRVLFLSECGLATFGRLAAPSTSSIN